MLSLPAKYVLSATSLMPLFLVVAIRRWEETGCWSSGVFWLGVAVVLVVVYWLMLDYAKRKGQRHEVQVGTLERRDHAIVSMLFVYLLPIIRPERPTFLDHPVTTLVVVSIILYAVAKTDSFHFNPVMWIFGQRCYSFHNGARAPFLLITKSERPRRCVTTVRLAYNVYLHIGDNDE